MSADSQRARDGFLIRYYRWSLAQWREEIGSGFALLRAFDGLSSGALIALEILGRLDREQQQEVARGLVRRAHKAAAALLGEKPSPNEEAAVSRWQAAVSQTQAWRETALSVYRCSRGELRAALVQGLVPLLGGLDPQSTKTSMRFTLPTGSWTIHTDFDLGGRTHQLYYDHSLVFEGQVVKAGISPLIWLGIGPTKLSQVSTGDETRAAACVVGLARHFISAKSLLLNKSL